MAVHPGFGSHTDPTFKSRPRPTLEVILTESPQHLCKEYDAESGLALIRL